MGPRILKRFLGALITIAIAAGIFLTRPQAQLYWKERLSRDYAETFKTVFPDFDNQPWTEKMKYESTVFFPAKKIQSIYEYPEMPSAEAHHPSTTISHLTAVALFLEEVEGTAKKSFLISLDETGQPLKFKMLEPRGQSSKPSQATLEKALQLFFLHQKQWTGEAIDV